MTLCGGHVAPSGDNDSSNSYDGRSRMEANVTALAISDLPTPALVLLGVIFLLLITFALFGNILVCIAIFWDRRLREQTENLFLVSLAISDALLSSKYSPLHSHSSLLLQFSSWHSLYSMTLADVGSSALPTAASGSHSTSPAARPASSICAPSHSIATGISVSRW